MQIEVMTHLWTLMSVLLLGLSAAEPLSIPEEDENEVLKDAETELTESQAINVRMTQFNLFNFFRCSICT